MPDFKELRGFPGPLVPGRTHKGEVIQFCQNKIQNAKLKQSPNTEIGIDFFLNYFVIHCRSNTVVYIDIISKSYNKC